MPIQKPKNNGAKITDFNAPRMLLERSMEILKGRPALLTEVELIT